MKIKLVYSMALALAVVLDATGCKHKHVAVTPIPPGQGAPVAGPGPGNTLGNENGGGMNNMGNVGGGPAPIAETANWDMANYTQDHDALAADTIHFAYDSAVIRDNEKGNLQAVAAALQDPNA